MPRETMAYLRLRLEASEVRAARCKAAVDELYAADAAIKALGPMLRDRGPARLAAHQRYARAMQALREVNRAK